MSANAFRVDPSNYLGIQSNAFRNRLYKIALSRPSYYFELRERVEKKVKEDCIRNLYAQIYFLLSEGALANDAGNKGEQIVTDENGVPLPPNFPSQKINEITLGLSKTLENALDEVIDFILPIDFQKILTSKLTSQGNAGII